MRRKVVHFLRHGHTGLNAAQEEALEQLGYNKHDMNAGFEGKLGAGTRERLTQLVSDRSHFDSPLSSLGHWQVGERQAEITRSGIADTVDVVLCSSLRRTMQTAEGALGPVIERHARQGKSVVVLDEWREFVGHKFLGNSRPARSTLKKQWADRPFDFSALPEADRMVAEHTGKGREPKDVAERRAWQALQNVLSRREHVVAVVTHGGFLGIQVLRHRRIQLIGDNPLPTEIGNCERISVELTQASVDSDIQMRVLSRGRAVRRKVVHFVRHAESTANAEAAAVLAAAGLHRDHMAQVLRGEIKVDSGFVEKVMAPYTSDRHFDASLSEAGKQEARELSRKLKQAGIADRVEAVMVSSSQRTLQTADVGFASCIQRVGPAQVVISDLWRELHKQESVSAHRKTKPEILAEWGHKGFDFTQVTETDELESAGADESPAQLRARAWTALSSLFDRPETEMAVVTHGGFFGYVVVGHRDVVQVGQWPATRLNLENCAVVTLVASHAPGDNVVRLHWAPQLPKSQL